MFETIGGCLVIAMAAAARAVVGVPRSWHGADLGAHSGLVLVAVSHTKIARMTAVSETVFDFTSAPRTRRPPQFPNFCYNSEIIPSISDIRPSMWKWERRIDTLSSKLQTHS